MVSKSGSPGPAPTRCTMPIGRARSWRGAVEQADQLAARADLVAGQRHLADAAGEDAIPEAPARARLIERAADLLAEDLGEARHPADRRRQGALDLGAQPARQRRRGTAGRDGDGDGRAIDDRRHDEARKLRPIDDVHRHAALLGGLRHARLQRLVVGGDDHQRHAGEIAFVEGATCPGDAVRRRSFGRSRRPRCRRSGSPARRPTAAARPCAPPLGAADHQHVAVLQGEEEREALHHAAFRRRFPGPRGAHQRADLGTAGAAVGAGARRPRRPRRDSPRRRRSPSPPRRTTRRSRRRSRRRGPPRRRPAAAGSFARRRDGRWP